MTKTTIDALRLMRLLADSREIHPFALNILNRTFAEVMAEADEGLEKTVAELKKIPLALYKNPDELRTVFDLMLLSKSEKNWDFWSFCDPEKTGILYTKSAEETAPLTTSLLTKEFFNLFFNRSMKLSESSYDFYWLLYWWRIAICCCWSAKIVSELINVIKAAWRNESPLSLETNLLEKGVNRDVFTQHSDEPIGIVLNLSGIDDNEIIDARNLFSEASWGSKICEREAAQAFQHWVSSKNVDFLFKCRLRFENAHSLLLCSSRTHPEINIEPIWNQEVRAYQFECLIENLDRCGYKDSKKTISIPPSVLAVFFNETTPEVRQHLIRLLLRGGFYKAKDLLRGSSVDD